MRRWFLIGLAITALAVPGAAVAGSSAASNFEATLTGAEEVPVVITDATGQAEFEVSADGKSVHFQLEVADISHATQGHIHLGKAGVNGPVVVFLLSKPGQLLDLSGEIEVEGTFTAADLIGPLKGKPLSALVDALRSGNAYANVHTKANPGGEIRGQIVGDD